MTSVMTSSMVTLLMVMTSLVMAVVVRVPGGAARTVGPAAAWMWPCKMRPLAATFCG